MKTVLLGLICAIAGIGTAPAQAPAKADRETQKRALILYTLRKELPFTDALERVYQKTLSDGLAGRLDYYAEYIDVARFPEPGYQEALRDFLRRKYAEQRFDLIIASGNATFEFVARHGAEVFPGAPVVFTGYGDLRPIPNSTGLIVKIDLKSTLDLALRLQPEVKRVFVVCGASGFEKYFENIARRQFQEYEGRLAFTYLTRLPLEDMQGVVAKTPEDSIIYFLSLVEDGAGNRFIPLDALGKISSVANAPIYSWYDVTIDHGIVGGSLVSVELVGRQTAELALRTLRGENPERIPVAEVKPNINVVDWRQLRRWGISEDRLPPGSVIKFKEPSFWNHYKWRIIGVVSLCAVEGLLIFALLAQRARRRRVEEALRDNEERLKLALSAANMGAWDWRLDTDELKWSDEMRQIFGFAGGKSAVTTELFFDLIHPDDRPAVSQAITRTINQGAPYDIEFRTIHQDGSIHWVMGKGKALLDKAGQAARMLGVNMDITDRKRAEERLRSYFELPLIGMAITSPDRRFVEVNQKLCDILGYSMDQLTGMSWVDVTHPDDVAENIRLLDETLRGKTEGYVMDKRFIHRDGRIVYTSISARCARRADRTVDYLALIVQDITQRKQAEDRLMESEAQLRLLTELIPQHVWTGFPGNIADYRNQRWLDYTGMTIEEARYKGWMTALHPDDHERVVNAIRDASSQKGIYEVEIRLKGFDGQYRWFLARALPQLDQEGNIIKWYGTNTDIEDRKRAEEALRESEERLRHALEAGRMGVWERDTRTDAVKWSKETYTIMGLSPFNLEPHYHTWADRVHPDDLPVANEEMRKAIEEKRDFRYEYRIIWPDGSLRWVEGHGKPAYGEDGQCLKVSGLIVDISERKRTYLRLNTQYAISHILSEAASVAEAASRLLQVICESLGWEFGAIWLVDREADHLTFLESWGQPSMELAEFVSASRQFIFPPGVGLPGRVWKSRQPVWINDVADSSFPRASLARRAGLHNGFGFPALLGDEMLGVMVFFSREVREPDEDLLQMMASIGSQIGQFAERKQAEEALRESEERYRSVVESQTELICRYLPDTTLTFVNDAYCRYFGKTWEDLIGTKFLELIPEPAREVARKHIESLVENPRVEMDEHEVLLPDGSIGWQQWVDHAILDANGKVVEFQAVGRDITERKQAEEERREGEERLRLALEAGRMGAWEWDARTNAVKWSKEHYTVMGLKPFSVEPDYQTWADRVHPDDLPLATETMSRAIEEKGEYRCEYRIIWSDGSVHWVEGRGKPVYDEGGQCLRVSGLIVDITERKEAEWALRESEEALRKSYARIEDLAGRLIASQEEERRHIARELHDDLNQQVAALAIGISRLKRQFPDAGAAVQEQIVKLQNKTDLLSERIRQVSHELHSSILQHVGLPAALNSYCAEFSDREGIAVALDIGDGFEAVPPEAALCLYRVAQESLRNVARHSGARRAVVTLSGVNGAIELRVADQGVGFDPGQARECRGLGLVSMEERVKLLHGNFLLTTRPGAGTELRAQIPLRGEHEQTKGIVG